MNTFPKNESIIATKSYVFALEIIKLYKFLTTEKKEYVLSKQILRCGTSIGANVNEGISAHSKRDFVYKLSLALKESKETSYWLHLLKDSDYISYEQFTQLNDLCQEIDKILSSIIITTKKKYFDQKPTHNSKL